MVPFAGAKAQVTPKATATNEPDYCLPNRQPQTRTAGTRRGGRKPTVQCNLVSNEKRDPRMDVNGFSTRFERAMFSPMPTRRDQ